MSGFLLPPSALALLWFSARCQRAASFSAGARAAGATGSAAGYRNRSFVCGEEGCRVLDGAGRSFGALLEPTPRPVKQRGVLPAAGRLEAASVSVSGPLLLGGGGGAPAALARGRGGGGGGASGGGGRGEAERCPQAQRLSRWHHRMEAGLMHAHWAFGETFLACQEDGRWIGPVYIQPRLDAARLERSDWLISVVDASARLRFSAKPCQSAVVRDKAQPDKCLMRLEMAPAGFHLRSLLYALPGRLGLMFRQVCIRLDDQERAAQDIIEGLALVTLVFFFAALPWLMAAPKLKALLRRVAPGRMGALYSPGTYQATRQLSVHPCEFDKEVIGTIEVGSEFEVLEVRHHSEDRLAFGLVSRPAGWIRLRDDDLEPESEEGLSGASSEPPSGIQLRPLGQVYGNVIFRLGLFVFSFSFLMLRLVQIVPLHSPSKVIVSSSLAFPVFYGIGMSIWMWAKGCRYITYHVALSHGKLFCPAVHEWGRHRGMIYTFICYLYIFVIVSHALLHGVASGNLEFSQAASDLYSMFTALVFNAKCLKSFAAMEDEARLGVCVAHVAPQPKQGALQDHVSCKISLSLPVVHERTFVAAGRRGLTNLLEQPLAEQITTGFVPADAVWFSRFAAEHRPGTREWGGWLPKAWPVAVAAMVAFQACCCIWTSTRHSLLEPALSKAWALTGTMYPPITEDLHDVTVFVDKDLSMFSLYAQAEAKFISSMTFGMQGSDAERARSTSGSMLVKQEMSSSVLQYPPRWELAVRRGASMTTYSIHVQPVSRVITGVFLSGMVCDQGPCRKFNMCKSWAAVRSTRLSVPFNMNRMQIRIEVSEHILGIPVTVGGAKARADSTYTTFEQHSGEAATLPCKHRCARTLSCVDYIRTLTGCYLVHTPGRHHGCRHFRRRADGEHKLAKHVPQPVAHACHRSRDPLVETCLPMRWDEDGSVLRLDNFSVAPLWTDTRSRLMLRYSLLPNAFMSGIDKSDAVVRLKRGSAELMTVLAVAEPEQVRVSIITSSAPRVTVVLHEYDAHKLQGGLMLFLTPIVQDTNFFVSWAVSLQSDTRAQRTDPPNFPECREQAVLSFFDVCGGRYKTRTMRFRLNPWEPFQEHVLRIQPKSRYKAFFAEVRIPITITTQDGEFPLTWLMRRSCEMPEGKFSMCRRMSASCMSASAVAERVEKCPREQAMRLLEQSIAKISRESGASEILVRFVTAHPVDEAFVRSQLKPLFAHTTLGELEDAVEKVGLDIRRQSPLFKVVVAELSITSFVRAIEHLHRPELFGVHAGALVGGRGLWPLAHAVSMMECGPCANKLDRIVRQPRPWMHSEALEVWGPLSMASASVLPRLMHRGSPFQYAKSLSLWNMGSTWLHIVNVIPDLFTTIPCLERLSMRRVDLPPEAIGTYVVPFLTPTPDDEVFDYVLSASSTVQCGGGVRGPRHLDLSDNGLSDAALGVLAAALPGLPTLLSLNVSLNGCLGPGAVEALRLHLNATLPSIALERVVVSPTAAVSAGRWRSLEASLQRSKANFTVEILNVPCAWSP